MGGRTGILRAPVGRLPGTAASFLAGVLLLLATGAPSPAAAQTLVGRVIEDGREVPIGDVAVELLDRQGARRVQTLTDSTGRFVLTPPEAGSYFLVASRLGYQDARSPLLALETEGSADIELMMSPAPLGLEGLEVSAEARAEEQLGTLGLTPAGLGSRWISRQDIEAVQVRTDLRRVIQWQGLSNVQMPAPENLVPGSDDIGLCVGLVRARGAGTTSCARVVLDGAVVSPQLAAQVDPDDVESIAILTPVESQSLYGTGNGAVLIWTRRGRAR